MDEGSREAGRVANEWREKVGDQKNIALVKDFFLNNWDSPYPEVRQVILRSVMRAMLESNLGQLSQLEGDELTRLSDMVLDYLEKESRRRPDPDADETEIQVIHSAMAFLWYCSPSSCNEARYLATLERLLSHPQAETRACAVRNLLVNETGDGACFKSALDTLRAEFELSPEERRRQSAGLGGGRGWPEETAAIGEMDDQIRLVFQNVRLTMVSRELPEEERDREEARIWAHLVPILGGYAGAGPRDFQYLVNISLANL
ncbi:MAG: hypothetical protein RDV41_09060, partial [Planctomycetota bacterium]|nr:hypothetical protein [Planctomycetota bacterium]